MKASSRRRSASKTTCRHTIRGASARQTLNWPERSCALADQVDRSRWELALRQSGAERLDEVRSLAPEQSHPLIARALEPAGVSSDPSAEDIEAHR
jgi:hypothetical protein